MKINRPRAIHLVVIWNLLAFTLTTQATANEDAMALTKQTMGRMRIIGAALESYYVDHNQYPVAKSAVELENLLVPRYAECISLNDAWGTSFTFEISSAGGYELASAGADKAFGKNALDKAWADNIVLASSGFLKTAESTILEPFLEKAFPVAVVIGLKPPEPTSQIQPVYPETLRKARIQGLVVLKAVVTKEGRVGSVKVLYSPSPHLSVEAVKAMKQWIFKPAVLEQQPVEVSVFTTFKFKLT